MTYIPNINRQLCKKFAQIKLIIKQIVTTLESSQRESGFLISTGFNLRMKPGVGNGSSQTVLLLPTEEVIFHCNSFIRTGRYYKYTERLKKKTSSKEEENCHIDECRSSEVPEWGMDEGSSERLIYPAAYSGITYYNDGVIIHSNLQQTWKWENSHWWQAFEPSFTSQEYSEFLLHCEYTSLEFSEFYSSSSQSSV